MNFKPTLSRVVIKRGTQDTTTAFGLVIPGAASEKPDQGIVLAKGPGRTINGTLIPVDVQINDNVIFRLHAGQEVKVGNEEFVILEESDILAVIN